MIRRSHLASQVGVMHSPGYGAMHWMRPTRRRGNLLQIGLISGSGVLAVLALIGAIGH